jgi:hypothetical protein
MSGATRFSCTPASLQRGEPVAGTASHVRTWLLLEHSGPWGSKALRDAALPAGLGAELQHRAARLRAKILLIRRPRAARDGAHLNVFAVHSDPAAPRLEHGTVTDAREVLDLDLDRLRAGGTTGLDPANEPIFCVCTNGRHDACCAEFGRPVAMALHRTHPDLTWEVSHIGGDRFAGNLVVLPDGLYYGRLSAETGSAVADAHLSGALALGHLRGRSSFSMPVQAAEIALRRELGLLGIDDLKIRRHERADELTTATFETPSGTFRVRVRSVVDEDAMARLTCAAVRDSPISRHDVVSVEPADAPTSDA